MAKPANLELQTAFDLGYADGCAASEDPDPFSMSSRVSEYIVGFVLGRAHVEAVRHAYPNGYAVVAGELGARYGVDKSALMARMELSHEDIYNIELEYALAAGIDPDEFDEQYLPHG